MTAPRDQAEAITDMLGVEDTGRTTEAFTRFFRRGSQDGWNSLTQDDFAMLEDALADGLGRPRRKRKHPLLWKAGFWWHWHVTSPIIYPVLEAPAAFGQWIAWHAWRKHNGIVFYAYRSEDGALCIGETGWDEQHDDRSRIVAETPRAYRIAARLGRLHGGWAWCCPDCGIDFSRPDATLPTAHDADEDLGRHVRSGHAGIAPEASAVTKVFWISGRRLRP